MFVWVFSPIRELFTHFGDITITAANLTFTRSSWPLSSEGSITCHTYCDTGQLFIISEDPWHSHLLPSVCQWSCHYLFNETGDRTPISSMRSERFTTTPPLGCLRVMKKAGTVVAHFLERLLCITKGQMFKSRQRQTYKNSHRSECQGISIVMSTEDESKFAVLYKQMVTTLYE